MSIKHIGYKQFLQNYWEIDELPDEDLLGYIVNEKCDDLVSALNNIIAIDLKKMISVVTTWPANRFIRWFEKCIANWR